ncbi:MAG: hypothetical protein HYZ16_00960 [Bacteroidetes bacterium]|nr:hypothetical protein [Bacteroidota bacterium]
MKWAILSVLVLSLGFGSSEGPSSPFRISMDFSIKDKRTDGTFSLQKGRAYYDKNHRKLYFALTFPKAQGLLTTDSVMYLMENGKLLEAKRLPGYLDLSIFHLCLSGNLNEFGLGNSLFTPVKVEQDKDMVMTTWEMNKKIKKSNRITIITSLKEGRLYGVVILNMEGEVTSKHFYENYAQHEGTWVPGKIVQIQITEAGEQYRIMEFNNILINEFGKENLYNCPLPTLAGTGK